ncbi:unnamed protein product [Closterium sp. NIES-53]
MRKLLRGMRLPNHQWPDAMDHAVMLHNLLSSSSLLNNASPHLLWTGKLYLYRMPGIPTIPNASYSIDSNGGAATNSNSQVGAGGMAAAGAVGAGNPVTAGTVKRGKKWRTGVAPAKKAGGGHPVGKGHRAPGQGHHVKGQPVLAR